MEELRPCPCCGEPYVRLISLGEGEGEEGARRKWNALAALAPNSYEWLYQDTLTILDRAAQVSQEADWLALQLAESLGGGKSAAQWREAARKAIGVDLGMEEKERKE